MPAAPVRTCIGCRGRASQADLVRLVWTSDGVRSDPTRRRPGRGAYLHVDPDCLALAVRRRAVGRALRRDGIGSADLAAALADLITPPSLAP